MTTLIDIQKKLALLGFDPGPADGFIGRRTLDAMAAALNTVTPVQTITRSDALVPDEWMPPCQMDRVHLHWTAGDYTASEFDRAHYHILINGDGVVVRGIPSIDANAIGSGKRPASHTRNANTGAIGVSMCCMGGDDVSERPFKGGRYPLTKVQWDTASSVVAELCKRYGITPTPKTVLSHAEVQVNLGIAQRGKWDIARLPFDPTFDTARECGDRFRAEVSAKLK